jgi:hypothetical protein
MWCVKYCIYDLEGKKKKAKLWRMYLSFINSTIFFSIHLYYNLNLWSKSHASFCVWNLSHSSNHQVLYASSLLTSLAAVSFYALTCPM